MTTKANALVSAIDNKLARDFTSVATDEVKLFLAAVLDLFSRKIVGWAIDDNLRMALLTRQLQSGLLHHSDRGSQLLR